MSDRRAVLIPSGLETQLKKGLDGSGDDSVERLASLDAPTTDIGQMLTEIESRSF